MPAASSVSRSDRHKDQCQLQMRAGRSRCARTQTSLAAKRQRLTLAQGLQACRGSKTMGGDMTATGSILHAGIGIAAAFAAIAALPDAILAQSNPTLDQRKALYAAWSPDQMAQRRKEFGLIGPGTTKPVPAPAFPSYLKKPDSIEALMPQARAAVRQTAGATPLGLADPGKHVLIVVGEIRDTKPDMMVQEAIKRAYEERGVKCTILTVWDLLALSEQEYLEFREGIRTYTIGDGQRELESFFTTTGFMPNAQKGRDWVAGKDPELARATWPVAKFTNERFVKLAKELFEASPNALVAWLDKHPEIDWIVWRSGNRPNSRKMLRHHGERFLGNY